LDAEVEAHSLQTAALNGSRGKVKGARGDRVAVLFPDPIGEKALKPTNLRLTQPTSPATYVHPDAKEVPVSQFEVSLVRESDELLGLKLNHEPPLDNQRQGQESFLEIEQVLPKGLAQKHNEMQQDPDMRLCAGDRILAVVDGSVPENKRRPVGGNSRFMMDVITSGRSPLILLIGRQLGPPLRFKVGQPVRCNAGPKGWLPGTILKVWDSRNGPLVPYQIRLKNGDVIGVYRDADDCIEKGEPRFKIGDEVMANQNCGYKKGRIVEVKDEKNRTSYSIKMIDGGQVLTAPDDLNMYVRPLARFTKGTKVVANVNHQETPGTIEAVYNPNWVYAIRLDAGNVVFAPEDMDCFIKKR